MPKPNSGESKSDFIGRCIGVIANEGKYDDPSQQAAICYSMWDEKKEETMKEANLGGMQNMNDDELIDAYEFASAKNDQDSMNQISKEFRKRGFEMNEQVIEITEDVKLPGTEVILEAGDKIKVLKESLFHDDQIKNVIKIMVRAIKVVKRDKSEATEDYMEAMGTNVMWTMGTMLGDKAAKNFKKGVRSA